MNKLFSMICLSALFGCSPVKDPVDYVDIFVGTSNSRAMLGPYAAVPYGMVQLGADKIRTLTGWVDTNIPLIT